jgi:hypothetical protein
MTRMHRWTRLIALSLTVFALAIPSVASAVAVGPTLGTYHAAPQADSPASVSGSSDSGFDWGDAALGATAVLAIMIVGAGAALLVRSSRGHTQVRPTT